MENIKSDEEKFEISKPDKYFIYAMIFLSLAIPISAALNVFELRPQNVTHGQWIQRSGALMVICAIYIESTKNRILDQSLKFKNSKFKNSKMYKFITYIYPGILIAGTFVWGYIDII